MHECLEECQSNLTFKLCNCVKLGFVSKSNFHVLKKSTYFYVSGDKNTRICSVADASCFNKAEHFMTREVEDSNEKIDECDCLPDCNSIEYEQNIVVSKLKPGEEKSGNRWETVEYDCELFV